MNIFLLEDDESLGITLESRLKKEGYRVRWSKSLKEAREQFMLHSPHVAILDVGLPDGTGFEFAQWIKSRTKCALIFMTALNSAENRLEGYELGAEEFIPKPFHLKELLIRLQHVIENHPPELVVKTSGVEINFDAALISYADGSSQSLTLREKVVLQMLIRKSPAVVSRDEILDALVGTDQFPSFRIVDNTVVRLRQLLGPVASLHLRSSRGQGYQWIQNHNSGGDNE